MRRLALVLLALAAPAGTLAAQESQKCVFLLRDVGNMGVQQVTPSGTNYFAGGGVTIDCAGTSVTIRSDSVAAYAGRVVQFMGNVKYRDSSATLDAQNGTYYKDGERWEARGNVRTTNLRTGSTLVGPSVDYFRAVRGVRDSAELYAVGRPTIRYVTKDSAGAAQEPYVVVGDRVRQRGEGKLWAGGKVTIDRSDFTARGDSLRLETGAQGSGSLVGDKPAMRGLGKDTFDLAGERIDFTMSDEDIEAVQAFGSGHAVTADLDLVADTIAIDLVDQKAEYTRAWGSSLRPLAVSREYEVRADSIAVDMPGQVLTQFRAFGTAWIGTEKDSVANERDWIAGDTVRADFATRDSSGTTVSRLKQLEAWSAARTYYRATEDEKDRKKAAEQGKAPKAPGLNYARADRIVVHMREREDGVERVDLFGNVDGIQLEPAPPSSRTATAPAATAPPKDDR
ncbi:MAG TPA: hypothetical protein VFX50_04600 [Gemmatimonadales bacterium]|nr:hypothetical protein [Gemmatimonadales bacterium]